MRIRLPNKIRLKKVISCSCGCGQKLNKFDERNRERKYVRGHSCSGWNKGIHRYLGGKRFKKGQIPWNKGKKESMPIPWNKGKSYKNSKISLVNKGKHFSIKTEFKKGNKSWSEGLLGKNNPLWREYKVTPLKRWLRGTQQYLNWQKSILKRDNYTCCICHIRGGRLCVHHFPKSFAKIINEYKPKNFEDAFDIKEFWNINNGQTLHDKCHYKFHSGRRSKF